MIKRGVFVKYVALQLDWMCVLMENTYIIALSAIPTKHVIMEKFHINAQSVIPRLNVPMVCIKPFVVSATTYFHVHTTDATTNTLIRVL